MVRTRYNSICRFFFCVNICYFIGVLLIFTDSGTVRFVNAASSKGANDKIRLKVQATKDVQLMIPFSTSKSIQNLIDQINKRSRKHRIIKKQIKDTSKDVVTELYVNDALLFEDDLVGDVLDANDIIICKWKNGLGDHDDTLPSVEVKANGEQVNSPPPPKDEVYKINMGRGLVMDVLLKPNGYVSDLADSIMDAVEGQLASKRTSIVELQLDGATLFPDDIANKLLTKSEVVNVVWGFRYTIQATDTIQYFVALYHNAKIRNLVYAARNLGLQHNQLKDRDDMIVDLRKANGMTLLEYHDQLVTEKLMEDDEVLHAVWGKIFFINPNIVDNEISDDNTSDKSPDNVRHNKNNNNADIEPLVVGVSDIGYVSSMIKNANIAVSQNSDVYYFAKKNIIVDIQLGDGSILDKNTLVTDAVSEGDELYAIWKDVNDVDDDDEEEN